QYLTFSRSLQKQEFNHKLESSTQVTPKTLTKLDYLPGLFGPTSSMPIKLAKAEQLPESNLDLQVSAIFFMASSEHSSVVLEDGNRTLILRAGEEARPGI